MRNPLKKRKMKMPVLKYPGAKNAIADDIISLFPPRYHTMTYLEPFFGSGAVFFRKVPGVVETVNDLNNDVYNLFYQIRHNAIELARLIEFTPWSRKEHEISYSFSDSDLENARRFLVRCWFSIGYASGYRYGWRHNIAKNNGGYASFSALPDVILETCRRLKPSPGNDVQIEHRDAFDLIKKYNRPNVLMYLDPPYVRNARRKNRKIYRNELSDEDHGRLCALLAASQAKVVLSGYSNDIYDSLLPRFNTTTIKAVDEAGNQRTEIVWRNFSCDKELFK
jgi:DNA adenine methylase